MWKAEIGPLAGLRTRGCAHLVVKVEFISSWKYIPYTQIL